MTPSLTPLDSMLLTIVLAILAIGLPVFFVMAIRFFWERKLSVGRSKDFEKLIWQLHRIASALEHQLNLSFPAVQPGTEEPRDLAYMQQPAAQARAAAVASVTDVSAPAVATEQAQSTPAGTRPPLTTGQPGADTRHGVNSMFGL